MTATIAREAPVAPAIPIEPVAATMRTRTATVTLFKPSGRFYATESWRVPFDAVHPSQMCASPDFHQINGGAVLVEATAGEDFPDDENFGVAQVIFVPTLAEVRL